MGRILKYSLIGLAGLILVTAGIFLMYTADYSKASETAMAAMSSGQGVAVSDTDEMITFMPEGAAPKGGYLFYPGGKVDAAAYAGYMRDIAKSGYLCVIVKMPLHLAVFNVNGADKVMAAFPEIKIWVIGGHSLGGAMASSYAAKNADKLSGIVFWASYPAADLSDSGLSCLELYGDKDGVLNQKKLEKARPLFPKDTTGQFIAGANHAQFGDYGEQRGDNLADISYNTQKALVVDQTTKLLEKVCKQ
jgi:hypothetical protein